MRYPAFCLIFLASPLFAEVVVEPSKEGGAAGFEFELQKGVIRYDGYYLWGKFTRTEGVASLQDVVAVFTAYDEDDRFLGRGVDDVKPTTGNIGFVNNLSIETGQRTPARVEWLIIARSPSSASLKVDPSTEETADDVPLGFQLQKVGSGYSGLSISGKVVNNTNDTYQNVLVIITLYTDKGKFLGRGRTSVSPDKIGPGQVAYLDDLGINAKEGTPARLEWKVVQRSF